jgi:hypothetical protein
LILDQLFSGKIRLRLLTRFLLNPSTTVFLRGLEKELDVSSNTVRLELNKLSDMHLIEEREDEGNGKTKLFSANIKHPLFKSLRGIILQHVGIDQIIDQVLNQLGNVEKVYLTGDLALGRNSPFIDLILVGNVDRAYLFRLTERVENLIDKKIRVALYKTEEFQEEKLKDVGIYMNLLD